jgi:dipeptidyl aminopeptidase/acylaminoacyl peptidase
VSLAGIGDVTRMLRDDISEGGSDETLRRALEQEIGIGRDMRQVSPIRFAGRADAPVLLIHGLDDTVVPFSQSRNMANALRRAGKPVELIALDGEDHWLSNSATRLKMLEATVGFVEKHNPADPPPVGKAAAAAAQ